MNGVPVIGLFSGAGGLELGATWAGTDVRLSVELDPVACETLRRNAVFHRGIVSQADVTQLNGKQLRDIAGLARRDPCIIIGGPPCQPFSKAAYWTDPGDDSRYRRARARGMSAPRPEPITKAKPDQRRCLVSHYWRLVLEADATAFLFENVPSIGHPRNRTILEQFIDSAETAGYNVVLLRVNAAEYGVAQCRHRVVVLGLKCGKPCAPLPTHSMKREKGKLRAVTAGKVMAPFHDRRYHEPEELVRGRWAAQLREIPPGQNYKALTAWAGHPTPIFEAETRFWHFLLKLSPDLPSWTVPANPGPWVGPFHWESRRLRTPELAALQSFPAKYFFAGSRRDRVRQIGNAVPPVLAQKIIEALVAAMGLEGTTQRNRSRRRIRCGA